MRDEDLVGGAGLRPQERQHAVTPCDFETRSHPVTSNQAGVNSGSIGVLGVGQINPAPMVGAARRLGRVAAIVAGNEVRPRIIEGEDLDDGSALCCEWNLSAANRVKTT